MKKVTGLDSRVTDSDIDFALRRVSWWREDILYISINPSTFFTFSCSPGGELLPPGLLDTMITGTKETQPCPRLHDFEQVATRDKIDRALGAIAEEDKRAFLYAFEHCPQLIEAETHPSKFVLRENFDVAKAITRLVLYWKYRCDVFGPDRAFRPMTISGDGALSPEDVAALSSGIMFPIQGPVPTLFMDKDRIYEQSPAIRKKIHFFNMQILSEVRSFLVVGRAGNNENCIAKICLQMANACLSEP